MTAAASEIVLPGLVRRRLSAAAAELLPGGGEVFSTPLGEPALAGSDSISWRVFKNPIALFIGGVAAVILEFAEPGVRSGVWDHSSFRRDPGGRLRRTGLAAMITVYAARSRAEAMIEGVRRRHDRVEGYTPGGAAYRANDPLLLDWVQATAGFGFAQAYSAYARPLSDAALSRLYAEGAPAARLYGAVGAPTDVAGMSALFAAMRPRMEASPFVFEFLDIMATADLLPGPLRPLQGLLVRAAVEIVPAEVRDILGLDRRWDLKPWARALVRTLGGLADRIVVEDGPPALACRRLGLPANHLYRP
ncbi:oxygenase MpaB family protein [Phenylobacterium sp.]|uniref:oxygenase MpaB family protein n=1 Tax=Phenylobacterium sp. TaxID=1871053 RepID=UPI00272346D0|nr:oxygenase MpaB family protein [Phenylobacterium sp.]MDO8378651.1 oxygenase MpaB family protein [Phenylobacterium sp.]